MSVSRAELRGQWTSFMSQAKLLISRQRTEKLSEKEAKYVREELKILGYMQTQHLVKVLQLALEGDNRGKVW